MPKGNRKRTSGPTLTDIANRVGTTEATVSKALRGSQDISPKMSARICAAAEEMGFDYKHITKKNNSRRSVGVVFMELCSEYYNGIYKAFAATMEQNGYRVVNVLTDFNDIKKQEDAIEFLAGMRVSGILFLTELEFDLSNIEKQLKKYAVPAVIISRMTRIDFADVISVNHSVGVEIAIEYLAKLGHSNIAFIGDGYTGRREKAFRDTLDRMGLAANGDAIITDCGRFCAGGYAAAKKIFAMDKNERPTACFAAYDALAYGLLKAAREENIRIPDDFSVIGVDNNEISAYLSPALSSVKCPVEDVGRQASDMLLSRIGGSTAPFTTVFLTPELELRETTAEAKKAD